MARRSYKALWARSEGRVRELEDRVALLQKQNARLSTALAAFAEEIVLRPAFDAGTDTNIILPSHEFAAVEASLVALERFTRNEDIETYGGRFLYYRRHRIFNKETMA